MLSFSWKDFFITLAILTAGIIVTNLVLHILGFNARVAIIPSIILTAVLFGVTFGISKWINRDKQQ